MNPTEENAVVGERLRKIRKALRITQKKMGKSLGYSASTYCEIENGNIGINTMTYMKLAELYNVNFEYLFNERGGMFYKSVPEEIEKERREYTFDKNIDSAEKLYSMMKQSSFFCHIVLAQAQEIFHTKEKLIRDLMDSPSSKK